MLNNTGKISSTTRNLGNTYRPGDKEERQEEDRTRNKRQKKRVKQYRKSITN